MADISVKLNGDNSDFKASLDVAEARAVQFEAMLKRLDLTVGTAKKAQESAKAFEELLSGEEKLAALRAKNAYAQMDNEGKLSVLRQQASGLLEKISSMEGVSAEKLALQVQYEGKKSEIFNINRSLIAEATQNTIANTTEIAKQPGLLGKVSEVTDLIKKGFKDIGVSIQGAGMGVFVALVSKLGAEAINNAQKTRDEYDKLGKSVDQSTRSMAAFGDGIDAAKKGAVSLVGFMISGYTQMGDVLGSVINRMRGISEAQENIAQAAQRDADAATKRLEKLQQENRDVDKVAAAKKALNEMEAQAAYDRLDNQGKLQSLLNQNIKLNEQIANTEKDTVKYYERKKELQENLNKLKEIGNTLAEQEKRESEESNKERQRINDLIVDANKKEEERLKNQEKITAELARQKYIIENTNPPPDKPPPKKPEDKPSEKKPVVLIGYSQEDVTEMSGAELAAYYRKMKGNVSDIEQRYRSGTVGSADYDQGALFYKKTIRDIEAEQRLRSQFSQQSSVYSEAQLRDKYDTFTYDRLKQLFNPDMANKQATAIDNIDKNLRALIGG